MSQQTRRRHGTASTYTGGCRCTRCRAAWARYILDRNHRLGVTRARSERRWFAPPYGRRGFDRFTEHVLDVEAARTGRDWRDVIGMLVRQARVEFPTPPHGTVN